MTVLMREGEAEGKEETEAAALRREGEGVEGKDGMKATALKKETEIDSKEVQTEMAEMMRK